MAVVSSWKGECLSVIAVVAVVCLASVAPASLITNGGNDLALVGGEIPGWDEIVGTTWTQRLANPAPQSGSHYFFAGAGANHELAQTVDVSAYASDIDSGVQFFDFSGYVSGWSAPGDTSQIILEFEDASGVVLDSWDSGAIYNAYDEIPTWLQLTHSQFAPTGTRQVQVRLIAARNAGSNNDGYFDSIQLYTYVSHSIPILTVAHRGGAVYAPENTLAAFELVSNKCDMVEFDVRVSSDGHLVLMHDATVDRTTDGTGNVSALTLAQLKALDAGSWFSSIFAGEEISTFEEAIQTILPYATPVIERKAGTAASYVAAIQALGVTSDVMVISFDWTFLADVHALDPSIRLGALGSDSRNGDLDAALVTDILATGADIVWWRNDGVSTSEIDLVRSLGAEIFTGANGADVQTYVDLGVDGISSDDPGLVRYLLDHQPSSNEAFAEELVSYWKFDDGLTDINTTHAADVEERNPGTLEGFDSPPTWTTGVQARVDGALYLDGVDDYVDIPQSASLDIATNALTFSCWVKMEAKPSGIPEPFGGVYASLEDSYELYQDKGNSELRFKVTATNGHAARPGVPEADLLTGQWHHVVGIYNGDIGPVSGQASIYLDGKLKDIHTGNGGGGMGLTQWVKAGQHATFGQNGMGNSHRFSGHVDDVAIWRRALSHGELLQLLQSGPPQTPQGTTFVIR
ncbi:MAG: hypothetical protein ISS31_07480 [Kiritimatiellae bacterium]|nr:hypothetical protein [Kiritimatiellia bacterium]